MPHTLICEMGLWGSVNEFAKDLKQWLALNKSSVHPSDSYTGPYSLNSSYTSGNLTKEKHKQGVCMCSTCGTRPAGSIWGFMLGVSPRG